MGVSWDTVHEIPLNISCRGSLHSSAPTDALPEVVNHDDELLNLTLEYPTYIALPGRHSQHA